MLSFWARWCKSYERYYRRSQKIKEQGGPRVADDPCNVLYLTEQKGLLRMRGFDGTRRG